MEQNSMNSGSPQQNDHLQNCGNPTADTIQLNSTVDYFDLSYKRDHRIRIVLPDMADVKNGLISVFAPLSTALLGCRQGDVVKLTTNGRSRQLRLKLVQNY